MPSPVVPSTNAVPWVFQTGTVDHPAALFRQVLKGIMGNEGVGKANAGLDFKVTAGGGSNVTVALGAALVAGDDVSDQGLYFCYLDANTNVTLDGSTGFARTDLVIAQVLDATEGGGNDTWVLTSVTGASGGSPPALPDSALLLAHVAVSSGGAIGTITDKRVVAGSGAAIGSTFVGCKLYKSADANQTSGEHTAVWNSEAYDTDGWHDTATNTSRITVSADGFVALTAQMAWEANNDGNRRIQITKNGTVAIALDRVDPTQTNNTVHHVVGRDMCVAGDYYELVIAQNSGVTLAMLGGTDLESSWFAAEFLGA